jgi:toxin-antitoxin system PIN domain toxin
VIIPDSNLLLYAYNENSPYNAGAVSWWESCLRGSEPVGLTTPAVLAFLRIGTSTSAFPEPLTLDEAELTIKAWLDVSVTRLLIPPRSHIDDVLGLLKIAGSAGGNLTTDAQIAAIAMGHKATVHTADRDFMRFRGLDCHFPLDGPVRK